MFTISTTTKFRLLHMVTHALTAAGVAYVFMTGQFYWLWVALAMFLYSGIVGVNIALHRYYSHRSFKTDSVRDFVLLVSSFFPMLGSPAMWCSVHVFHHMTSDTDKDPHSPKNAGLFGSWFTLWPSMRIPLSIFRKFMTEGKMRFLHRHYFKLVTAYVLALLLIKWQLVMFLFAIPAFGCFHGAAAVAVLPHIKFPGNYRSHETKDNSYNSFLTTILSLGEGWHNNHHYRGGNYRHGEKWWELDVSAFLIKWVFTSDKNSLRQTQ
jgi:stearoyl-CoA desaturase (delta-9 desaturase)